MANGCRYCTGTYCSLLSGDLLGCEDSVTRFQEAIVEGALTDLEVDVVDFALAMNNGSPLDR